MRYKKRIFLCIVSVLIICTAVISVSYSAKAADSETPPHVTEVKLLRNQDNGQNHWLVVYFDKNVVSHTNACAVSNEDVRSKFTINGKSIYAYEAENKISTACYYNYPVGQNLIRVSIPVGYFASVFNADSETGEILNTQIVLQSGMRFENGVTITQDIAVEYFAAADTFLLPGQEISSIATNVEAVHYYTNVKHLRIYFDAPVGSATTTTETAQSAMDKILINGVSVKNRNLELYMDPASIIGPSSSEGNWFEWVYDESGNKKDKWGGTTGHINCRYMIRISMSSSTGSYNLKRDGTDVIEFLPGLKTANGKVLLNSVVFKLTEEGKERVSWLTDILDQFDKAKNIVEIGYNLSRGTDDKGELCLYPTGEHSPVSEEKKFTASEVSMYFGRMEMNGRSVSSIADTEVYGYKTQDNKFGLRFVFPAQFVKFDGTDTFATLGGCVFPNGNDCRAETERFVNLPLTAALSYEAASDKTKIVMKMSRSVGANIGEYASLRCGSKTATVESVQNKEITFSLKGKLSDGDILTVPKGTLDGNGYASPADVEYVYYAKSDLLISKEPSSCLLIDKVNAMKNRDGGANSWVTVDFRTDVVDYGGYPYRVPEKERAIFEYIKLNGRPITDALSTAEHAELTIYWTSASQLRAVIPSGNELIDFAEPLTVRIEKEFRTSLNMGVQSVFEKTLVKYSERDGMWKETFSESGKLYYTDSDLTATGIDTYNDEGENVSVAIQFDRDIAYGYFPHANSTAEFMSALLQQYYTQNEIKYFVYNGLGDSIRDNIILDGKSVWERMEAEGGLMNQRIMVHYGTVGTKTMQIFISKKSGSVDFIDATKEHTVVLKAGFQVPNGGVLAKDVMFIYSPVTKTWTNADGKTEKEIPVDMGMSEYFAVESSGCGSAVEFDCAELALTVIFAATILFAARRRIGE
ncbi:hypothetical protein [Pumilibacter intestinalis]|uniref:hypothetical protein n=1 Tax=Pumilibacter intestinalis TaxID=2941511 RepID=UPI00203B7ADB|nr:hypothetical protein [Pumilibacter intestinalis]